MRRADCAPLAGSRRREYLGDWEGLPGAACLPEEEQDFGRELRRRLEHCLTASQREAVDLCLIRGMSAVQAAKLLGVAPCTISRRLSRALGRLRSLAAPARPWGP